MAIPKVYIDGREGTTGLQIYERLGARSDIEFLHIDADKRKDVEERKKLLNAADIVFLCLPDGAAREAVELIENEHTRVIDASTAHRTTRGWVYGFPELYRYPGEVIGQARRVANPGCHATGFLAGVAPLVKLHILPEDYQPEPSPGYDDDEDLPPFVPSQTQGSDDDSVTIVACAAAAVVAALMAVFLIVSYRKD